jgi:tight adherence protein B
MIGTSWLVTVFLVAAATVVLWPVRSSRARRRALLGPAAPTSQENGPAVFGPVSASPLGNGQAVIGPLPPSPPANHRSADGTADDPVCARPAAAARTGTRFTGPARPGQRLESSRPPGRQDQRRPAGSADPPAGSTDRPTGGALAGGWRAGAAPGRMGGHPDGSPDDGTASAARDGRPWWPVSARLLVRSPKRTLMVAALVGTGVGGLVAGPVAAVMAAGYGVLGVRAVLRRHLNGRAERARRRRLDQLCALAADLRAGLPVPLAAGGLAVAADPLVGSSGPGTQGGRGSGHDGATDRLGDLARAAVRLADRTGAPLAELVERIEADARAPDRGLAAAAAQAAGARATAWLLAALPLGGIGLGYGIGVDPVAVLLHTPVGGGCAIVAIGLQIGGLLWAERLGAAPERLG